jgi:dTDP-4-amino-4,6-dideoxygalactose transaminase
MDKTRLRDLAILGGPPLSATKLHVGCPNIGNRAELFRRLNDLLDRRCLSNNGPYVEELERRTADLFLVRHSVAVCNATLGLELAVRALDLQGEVIVPSMTFVATAHCLRWHGLTPVFCDIDPATHNLDPDHAEALITPRTSAVLAVHLWGRPCPVDTLTELAARHRLRLLFDSAHAFGCTCRGRMVGSFGDAEVFSLHATKVVNAFEGGLITTNDDELARRLRLLRNFGFAGYDHVIALGTNAKMSEVAAAMGLTSMESFDDFVAANRGNYQLYEQGLRGIPGVQLARYDQSERCNYQYVVLEVDDRVTQISQADMVRLLWAENVMARKYFAPGCHNMPVYRELYPHAGAHLPATNRLAERLLILPTGTAVDEPAVRGICSVLQLALSNGAKLTQLLQSNPSAPFAQPTAA